MQKNFLFSSFPLVGSLGVVTADFNQGSCPVSGMGRNMMIGGGFVSGLLMLIFWVLVIIGLIYLIKFLSHGAGKYHKNEENAVEILKGRYARGEIDKAEYEQKRKDLQG